MEDNHELMVQLYISVRSQIIAWEGNIIAAFVVAFGAGAGALLLYTATGKELRVHIPQWPPITVIWVCSLIAVVCVTIGAVFQFYALNLARLQFYNYQLEKLLKIETYGLEHTVFAKKMGAHRWTIFLHNIFAPGLLDAGFVTRSAYLGVLHPLANLIASLFVFRILQINTRFRKAWPRGPYPVAIAVFIVLSLTLSIIARMYPFPLLEELQLIQTSP